MHAMQVVTLRNGFSYNCARTQPIDGSRLRLYLAGDDAGAAGAASNFIDIAAGAVASIETVPDPPAPARTSSSAPQAAPEQDVKELLTDAGARHDIDVDLLASVVKAESGGRTNAVSRTGARGLMQLMPETAQRMGVSDAFRPDQNIAGGTAYLDQMLIRYHDNLSLALAAYNAGPAAVDRYHGIPPYAETRLYVAKVEREFKRRKLEMQRAEAAERTQAASHAKLSMASTPNIGALGTP